MDAPLSSKEVVFSALADLEHHRDLLSSCIFEWKQLQSFLTELEKSLVAKVEALGEREKAFQEKTDVAKQALDRRDDSILLREEASLALVQEQKVAALAALEEERRKYLAGEREIQSNASAPAIAAESLDERMTNVAELPPANANSTLINLSAGSGVKPLCADMDGDGLRKHIVEHYNNRNEVRSELSLAFRSIIDPSRLVLKALNGFHLLGLDPIRPVESGATANVRACMFLLECFSQACAGGDHFMVPPSIKESAKEAADKWISKSDGSEEETEYIELKAQTFLELLDIFGIASEYDAGEVLKHVALIANRKKMPALCRSLGLTEHMPGLVDKLYRDRKAFECLSFAHHFGLMDRVEPERALTAHLKLIRRVGKNRVRNADFSKAVLHEVLMEELVAIKKVLKAVENYDLASKYSTDKLLIRQKQLEEKKAKERLKAEMERRRKENQRKREQRLRGKTAEEIEKEHVKKTKKFLKNKARRQRKAMDAAKSTSQSKKVRVSGEFAKRKAMDAAKSTSQSKKVRVSGEFAKHVPPQSAPDRAFYLPVEHGSVTVPTYELPGQIRGYDRPSLANHTFSYVGGNLNAGPPQSSYYHPAGTVGPSFYQSASAYSGPSSTYAGYQF